MTQVLYRKYRPKTFDEVEGQEHVVRTLQGALMSGRIGHAYLFCGPRGTGKTTMARLLAKELNCLYNDLHSVPPKIKKKSSPCDCNFCTAVDNGNSLDLIEIDAASNRGIDEIRNLKESAQVAAPGANYKVFIVDEVHMLTPPAFNALLKILEEPPSHVIFILATTEAHKVPETVLSRVQRFDFKKITLEQIQKKLAEIAVTEKLKIEDGVLALIASHASGSLRDAESSLTKLISYASRPQISLQDTAETLGIVPDQVHQSLLNLIAERKSHEALVQVAQIYEAGADLHHFLEQFVLYTREKLIALLSRPVAVSSNDARSEQPEFLIKVINLFVKAASELKFSPVPQLPVELAILELVK
jgi:DNA polymerase-3 subunit gamma/tau